MSFLPQLVRAALKTGNKRFLNTAFKQQQLVSMPTDTFSQTYQASEFGPILEAFNAMHNWSGTLLHPCFPQVLGFGQQLELLLHRSSPFPLMGLVHLGNQLVVNRLLENHDMSLAYHYGNVYFHQKGIVFTVEMVASQAGEVCITAKSDYLFRVDPALLTETHAKSDKASQPRPKPKQITEESLKNTFSSMQLPEGTGRRYAKISGDYNPIHLSKLSAGLFGFKQPIAHGMHTLALAISAIQTKHPQALDSCTISNDFLGPASLPCELQLRMTAKDEQTAEEQFELINKNAPKHKQVVISASLKPSVD